MTAFGEVIRLCEAFVGNIPNELIHAILGMLRHTPPEVTFLRRELFVAVRMILGSDLRRSVLPFLSQFFDESTLFGAGYTSHETLKGIVYSTLAEITHHIRSLLNMEQMAMAIFMFARNIHDDNMGVNMQTMSCKLLLNLVDSIRMKTEGTNSGRELLLVLLEAFVRKFHTLGEFELPRVFERARAESAENEAKLLAAAATYRPDANTIIVSTTVLAKSSRSCAGLDAAAHCLSLYNEFRHIHGAILNPHVPMSQIINDYRYIVKTLICGVKTLTWALTTGTGACVKSFGQRELELYKRLVKYGFRVLDIHMLLPLPNGTVSIRPANVTQVRSKEEKELLEHFIGTFNMLPLHDFVDIISDKIEFIVQRIQCNQVLQMIANGFLAQSNVSAAFASILIRHLLEHIEDMGKKEFHDRSNLHLRLFKLVFGSVSLYPTENEHMLKVIHQLDIEMVLKPNLHTLVMRSVELSLTSEDPYNYLLLTRALFRSIGGGTHDLLYQEFLPLLPTLLRNLNNLFGGQHQQHIKDLFIELCLTVPVRLSSLLPYLPLLMGPLVAALNRTPTLMSQGLRTLELCVDNLNPEFLMDHISPVKARLFEALWNIVRDTNDQLAMSAIKLLAKFGGMNRRTLNQTALKYREDGDIGPLFSISFNGTSKLVHLPMGEAVGTALLLLKDTNAEPHYRKQAWLLIRAYIAATLSDLESKDRLLQALKAISIPETFAPDVDLFDTLDGQQKAAVQTLRRAVSGVILAAANSSDLSAEIRQECTEIIRHFILLIILQQCGSPAMLSNAIIRQRCLAIDPMVVIDGIVEVISKEDKEIEKICDFAFKIVLQTVTSVFGHVAISLPLFSALGEKVASLCFRRSWYAKNGGCFTIYWLVDEMPLAWLLQHEVPFIKALYFVILDLQGEVAGATVSQAEKSLEALVRKCHTTVVSAEDTLHIKQCTALAGATQYFINEITSSSKTGRKVSQKMIRVIAELSGKDTVDVISPHKELLSQKVPPAKFQLRNQPLRAQIGLLDGNTFCLNLRPRIFFIDMDNTAHQTFIKELKHLCEDDDATLRKNPCYKTGTSLVEVRIAALRALASCADVPQLTASVFTILLQAFAGGSKEMQAMQQVAVTLMQEYIGKYAYDIEQVQMHAQPIMLKVSDNRSSNLQIINRLRWITHVFPKVFTDSFCELMLNNLKKWLEIACFHSSKQFQQEIAFRAQSHAQQQQSKESLANNRRSIESNVESELRCCHAFVMLLSECRKMPQKMLEHLLSMLLAGIAKTRSVHVPGLLIEPLFTLLERFKAMVQNYFVANLHDMVVSRTFLHLLQHEKGVELRTFVEGNVATILQHLTVKAEDRPSLDLRSAHALAVRIIRVVGRANEKWLSTQHKLIASLRGMWDQPSVQSLLQKRCEFVACDRWVEPKRIAKCILQYVKYNPGLVEALFPLLRAVESRSIVSYHFISSFIDEVIVQGYTVEQRRDTYFKFHRVYHDSKYSMDVKCSILQHIIIPMFHYSFHNGVVDELLGGPPDPDGDDEKNIVHQFLLHVMFQEGLPAPSESMTIFLQQFATLLIQYAPQHIHDTNTKVKHGSKLKTLMSLAWPCLGNRVAVDPIAKFNGHMLFANCFLQFAVHKKIPLQMFHCLLQANGVEGRGTVKKVIDVLTPALPVRIDDGRSLMVHWTKQVLVEEGHSAQQLVHVLNVICRHHVSYFPARHSLVQHLLTGALRLAFGPAEKNRFNEYKATLENRRIALETIETVYNWERLHIDAVEAEAAAAEAPMATGGDREASTETSSDVATAVPARRPSEGAASEAKKAKPSEPSEGGFEKKFSDQLVNFLIRLSCLAGDATTATGGSSRDGASSSSTASSSNSASAAGGLSASLPSSGGSHMIMQLSSSSAITPAEFARRTHALLSKCLKPSFWQDAVISMQPIEHAFSSMADTVSSVLNVCSALEVVTLLLDALPRVQVLAHFKAISAGVISCMSSTNNKIVKSTQQLMARLTTLFPIEPLTTGAASKYEELEELYTKVSVVVTEGFGRYDRLRDEEVARAASTPPSARPETRNVSTVQMHATLQLLKAVCSSSNVYVDRFIPVVIRVLGRMQKDHIDPAKATDTTLPEQIGVAIDLLKLRLVVMNPEQRKQYLQCVATLIEKSPDIKLVRSISTIVEEWISTKSSGQSPTAREKGLLLSRLMACQEKRFSADTEFVSQFLDLVALVYRSETSSSGSELASKLEPAFLAGLRSTQPQIRSRFFELFNQTIPSRLYERLFYILCTQDWSAMGSHFWIKQCVELVLSTAHKDKFAVLVSDALKLPAAGMSNVFVPSGCRITPLGSPLVKHDTAMDSEDKKPATVQSRKSTKTLSVPPAQDVPPAAAKVGIEMHDLVVWVTRLESARYVHLLQHVSTNTPRDIPIAYRHGSVRWQSQLFVEVLLQVQGVLATMTVFCAPLFQFTYTISPFDELKAAALGLWGVQAGDGEDELCELRLDVVEVASLSSLIANACMRISHKQGASFAGGVTFTRSYCTRS
ncbi:transformation/transcription domain-associated protein-like [Sycon ciliatum]|uniref:transformation/transcription domain-associated protein-like n=1 Tax=Sycon ciliatum TaxID=27933 RepID=UPI0031F6DBE8